MAKLIATRPFFWKKNQYRKGDEVNADRDTGMLIERGLVIEDTAIEGETKELKIKRVRKPKGK